MKQSARSLWRGRLIEIAWFLLLLASYSYAFPRWADPNQNPRLEKVVTVAEDGTFELDKHVRG